MNQQQYGQFFTTNADYILKDFERFVINKNIVDPFCGNKDLLKWAKNNGAKSFLGFDIDEKYIDNKLTFLNDSLKNPKKYDFVLTNPPYLYKGRTKEKKIFLNKKHTDLYQVALESILNSNEGIVIVPVNFLSAENSKYIRILFFEKFNIIYCKYFTQQVFDDTTYNVIVFYYKKKTIQMEVQEFILNIQPINIFKNVKIYKEFNWQIGGEFIELIDKQENLLGVKRLVENDLIKGNINVVFYYNHLNTEKEFCIDNITYEKIKNNIILLKAIDTGSENGKVCLEDIRKYGKECLISLESSRNQIYLTFKKEISIDEQKELILIFNEEINKKREEYFSLFMTNFRDNNRKRISFDFVYKMINYLYFTRIKGERLFCIN